MCVPNIKQKIRMKYSGPPEGLPVVMQAAPMLIQLAVATPILGPVEPVRYLTAQADLMPALIAQQPQPLSSPAAGNKS